MWEVSWRRGQTATYWPKVSSDHSSTSFAFWLCCSTVGHWGPRPSLWSCFSLRWHPISNWNCNWPKPSVAPGYIIVWRPPVSCGRTHLPPSPNSTTSTGPGDIPISLTGCTCFAVLRLIYTVASLDWRLGQGSICYIIIVDTDIVVLVISRRYLKVSLKAVEVDSRIWSVEIIHNCTVKNLLNNFEGSVCLFVCWGFMAYELL